MRSVAVRVDSRSPELRVTAATTRALPARRASPIALGLNGRTTDDATRLDFTATDRTRVFRASSRALMLNRPAPVELICRLTRSPFWTMRTLRSAAAVCDLLASAPEAPGLDAAAWARFVVGSAALSATELAFPPDSAFGAASAGTPPPERIARIHSIRSLTLAAKAER